MKNIIATSAVLASLTSGDAMSQTVSPEAAGQEWRSYIEPLLPIGERLVAQMSGADDPQLRQEMYRQLMSAVSMAYMGLLLGDPEHPDFWPLANQAFNALGPNPDDTYYLAPIDGNGTYRISGYRGTVHMVDFQIGTGLFIPRGLGPWMPNAANYDLDKYKLGKDGYFEAILSNEKSPASLEMFSLTEEMVTAVFADYRKRFEDYL